MTNDLADLAGAIRQAWIADTSADPTWTPDNPALGQCAVTALAVQDRFGGDLLRVKMGTGSHYYNHINGQDVDLTRDQFATYRPTTPPEPRSREYVLSFPDTARRYRLLSDALNQERTRMRTCSEPGCDQPAWLFGRCRGCAMVPLGQEDPEDRVDDPGGDE